MIQQSRPVAPPTPVGTNYQSKQNELAEIRKTQESLVGAGAPAGKAVEAPTTATPPAGFRASPVPAPVPQAPVQPAGLVEAVPTPAPAQSSFERPAPVGTSYTPVSLPKPGKLNNRWGQNATPQESTSAPAAPAATRPSVGATFGSFAANATPAPAPPAGANKPLTWTQRQELAKKQREEEEQASKAAGDRSLAGIPQKAPAAVGAFAAPAAPAAPPRVPAASRPAAQDDEDEWEAPPQGGRDSPEPVVNSPAPAAPAPPPPPPPPPPAPPAPPAPVVRAPSPEPEPVGALSAGLENMSVAPRNANSGIRARVLFDYAKDEENEMELVEGEIVEQIEMVDEGWWSAVGADGRSGLFPCKQSSGLA